MSNKGFGFLLFAAAVAVALLIVYGMPSLPGNWSVHSLNTPAQKATPAAPAQQATPEPTPWDWSTPLPIYEGGGDEPAVAPAVQPQRQERRPPTTCMDGSQLTVTGRDASQTSYKCASGAVGAYTN